MSTGEPMSSAPAAAVPSDAIAQLRALAPEAERLADQWARATEAGATRKEKATTGQLAALLRDPSGLDLAVRFVDRVARPEDTKVAAKELSALTSGSAASFLGRIDRSLLGAGAIASRIAPDVVVPIARRRLRQIVGHLVVDANDPKLAKHLAASRADGFRLNINLLGEAVLGEEESASRTARTQALLERDDVDYVSIKVSSLVSQINQWDTEGTVRRCLERLRPLYRAALKTSPHSFVNLDMEEYKDLDLTIEVFTAMLSEPEFKNLEAGIVLQAYLPDALPAMERLIAFARNRVEAGGAPIKIRLVKGANLAMEAVEAEVHGWAQAPYTSKEAVDANYLRCLERALRPELTGILRIGIASHNLYDVALAHLLAQKRGVTAAMDVEMLQGMSPSQARAVRDTVGTVILYTPVVAPEDFDVAVSYLVRRLEENAAPQNFLHAFFSGDTAGAPGPAMTDQLERFRRSIDDIATTPVGPRRTIERPAIDGTFANTPDSDPALPDIRVWAQEALERPAPELTSPILGSPAEVDEVIARAAGASASWAARPASERAAILRDAARALEAHRGDLLTVMSHEAGKTLGEADPEISEAVDFARYYADSAEQLDRGAMADGATFTPDRVVLVTPPWNFPVAIPIGGVLAGLAAGSAVVIKPAPQTPGCVEVAVAALHEAGVPADVLQVVRTDEGAVGQALISHADVDTVVLTGASETAALFAGWRAGRPGGARVYGETSGKNALIVTPAADLDLAVADLVRSAFGHAGQKCSAASLGILVGSVGTSDRFRRQLIDAVRSLAVGWPIDLGATMGPVIEEPHGKLRRALTTLEPGETWLVEPKQLDDTGRLWSPGLKDGVRPGSFFHTTEVFGPVLGLMRAKDLDEAITLQNATAYGLTGGLHSLDTDEIATWMDKVEVGNAYVNRHITGAIVERQSFGGWKASSIGPGAKAGGPNYVAQLGSWAPAGLPAFRADASVAARGVAEAALTALSAEPSADERVWLDAALGSDAAAWSTEFGVEHDRSGLSAEANVFRYRPAPRVTLRVEPGAKAVELARLLAAAALAGSGAQVSAAVGVLTGVAGLSAAGVSVHEEDTAVFAKRIAGEHDLRVRVLGDAQSVLDALGATDVDVLPGPVLATGRRELLTFLREQAISRTKHRFGHLPPSERTLAPGH
ncbi:bifunctional proline dehydrogenase/L-glutamate gamma-semialdehyde dehydrogenase [Janibacter sp. G1551]|uniref:bifunctional proline dehydrogenase/L-glutamate gamma-semialdehyde dehydrogenase n=1 Tax=Janibacter sp. G1551 TaxID=3420440 RepID=UPI003D08F9A4